MNALEKARLAKEAERQEKEAKRAAKKFDIFGISMILVAIGIVIFTVTTIINECKGLSTLNNESLNKLKTSFYISLAIIAIGVGLAVLSYFVGKKIDYNANKRYYKASYGDRICGRVHYEFEKKSLLHYIPGGLNALAAVANLVMVIITIFSGKLGIVEYYENENDGIVYAQTRNQFKIMGVNKDVNEITIRGEVNGFYLDTIKKGTIKPSKDVKTVNFVDGDINFGKKAFAGWSNIEVINFDENSYNMDSFVFKDAIKLKEVNVGAASITISTEYVSWGTYSSTVYDNIFGGITNATITVNGGKLYYLSDSVNTYKIGNNSEVVIVNSYEDASYKNNSGYAVNKKLVLLDGFTFDNSILVNSFNTKMFGFELQFYPFAYTMYIPKSVTHIPDSFFGDRLFSYNEVKVYYAGSEAEWNNVSIDSTNNSNYTNGKVKMIYNTPYSE